MQIERINPSGVAEPPPSYTHLVKATGGTTLYIAGQVAYDTQRKLVGGSDLRAQTVQVFENLKTILASQNADFSNVVKVTIFKVNYQSEDREALVSVMKEYISLDNLPTSTLLGVQSLAQPELLIEIEAIAVI